MADQELASFAISEYNKNSNSNLVLDKVINTITFVASEGGQKKTYEAKVSINASNNAKELQDFKVVGHEASTKPAGGISSVTV